MSLINGASFIALGVLNLAVGQWNDKLVKQSNDPEEVKPLVISRNAARGVGVVAIAYGVAKIIKKF